MTEPAAPPDPATVQADINLVTGGRFNADSVGTRVYGEVVARVRAHPDAYVAAAEAGHLGARFDAVAQSTVALPALLRLLLDAGPGARGFGESLLRHYDSALIIPDRVSSQDALAQVLDEDTVNLLARLDARRRAVRAMLDEKG
jgi:hypothetical protein